MNIPTYYESTTKITGDINEPLINANNCPNEKMSFPFPLRANRSVFEWFYNTKVFLLSSNHMSYILINKLPKSSKLPDEPNKGDTMDQNEDINLAVKALKIGNKLRELRLKNQYTLQDLAAKTDLSKPFISQIENGHVVPPIATLLKLARALNVGMAYFFQDEVSTEKISLTRSHERVKIDRRPHHQKGEVSYIYEALETKKSDKQMEPFLVIFPVQDTSDMVFVSHEGEEFLYLLEGKLEFRSIERVERLEPGDSIYFESDISHSFRCVGDKPAKAIVVVWSKK